MFEVEYIPSRIGLHSCFPAGDQGYRSTIEYGIPVNALETCFKSPAVSAASVSLLPLGRDFPIVPGICQMSMQILREISGYYFYYYAYPVPGGPHAHATQQDSAGQMMPDYGTVRVGRKASPIIPQNNASHTLQAMSGQQGQMLSAATL